jgi:hypothetical protein
MADRDKPKRPRQLLNAIIGMYAQTALNLFAGVLLFWAIGVEVDHGRDVPGAMHFVAYLSIGIAVVLVCCAILVTRGVSRARYPAAVIEALNIIGGLIMVVSALAAEAATALGPGLINIVLSAMVLVGLFSRGTSEWFDTIAEQRVLRQIRE